MLFFLFFLLSCNNGNPIDKIQNNIEKSYLKIGIDADISVKENEGYHLIVVTHKEGYLLDKSSPRIYFNWVIQDNRNLFTNIDSLDLIYLFQNFDDIEYDEYNQKEIQKVFHQYSLSPELKKIIPFINKSINTIDYVAYDLMIEESREIYNKDDFKFKGTFWDLVFDYTANRCDTSTQVYKDYQEIVYAASYPKHPIKPAVLKELSTIICTE